MMKRVFCVMVVTVIVACSGWAQMQVPARHVTVSTNDFSNLAPLSTNTDQAVLDYIDDHALFTPAGGTTTLNNAYTTNMQFNSASGNGLTVQTFKATSATIQSEHVGTGDFHQVTGGTVDVYQVNTMGLMVRGNSTVIGTETAGTLVSTGLTVNGVSLRPTANWDAIYITNGTTSADIEKAFENMDKYNPLVGYSHLVYFAPGTYIMTNCIYIYGSGSPGAALRICGADTATNYGDWSAYGPCRTNQFTTLDGSSLNGPVFRTDYGMDQWIIMDDLHIKCKTSTSNGCFWGYGNRAGAWFAGCYFEGDDANAGVLVSQCEGGKDLQLLSNTFGTAFAGVGAGEGVTASSMASTNAPGQTLKYAYWREGGHIWTNSGDFGVSTLTGSVARVYDNGAFVP